MRLVYLPVVSARNIQSAPSYNFWRSFRTHALEIDPNSVFFVLVPKVDEDNRWQGGADWDGPRTHVIEIDMHEHQFDDLALVTRDFWEKFNERFGEYYFDVILSERPMLAPMLRNLASFHVLSKSRNPLVVNRDQFVMTSESEKIHFGDELLEVFGWVSAPTIYQSPHQLDRAMTVARKHVTGTNLARMRENSMVFPLGIDCAEVDQINMAERSHKYEKLTVNYSHKLFIEQKFLESLKIMDSTFAGGRPIELQIVTGSSASKMHMLKSARQYKYIRTYGSMGRTAFLKQMAQAHVFISNSWYEDFSATVVEQMYSGLIPVLVREPWSEYLVPNGYPYLFESMSEGQAMLRYVCDNYEAVHAEWMPDIQEKIRREFDLNAIVPRMVVWIAELNEKRLASLRAATPALTELIGQVYEWLPTEFDLELFYDGIKKHAENLDVRKQATESRATSPWLCVDILLREHPDLVDTGDARGVFRKGD